MARQLLAVLLQRDRRRAAAGIGLDRERPFAAHVDLRTLSRYRDGQQRDECQTCEASHDGELLLCGRCELCGSISIALHDPLPCVVLIIVPCGSIQANPHPHSSTALSRVRIPPAPFSHRLRVPPPARAPDAHPHSPDRARSSAPPSTPPAPTRRSRAPRAPRLPSQTSSASTRRSRATGARGGPRSAASTALSHAVRCAGGIPPAAPAGGLRPVRRLPVRRASSGQPHAPPPPRPETFRGATARGPLRRVPRH